MKTELNEAEIQTLQNLANGIGTKKMSSLHNVPIYTTIDRRKSAFKKLGVHTIEHAVAEALRRGLIK